MSDTAVIFIPARYQSSRFPGKPLTRLTGVGGVTKTLIQRSWEAAMAAQGVDAVYVVTDDSRIQAEAEGFGARVLMTSSQCRNGTERCAEALEMLKEPAGIVVNLQGDAPLTPPWYVENLIAAMRADPSVTVATPVLRSSPDHLRQLRKDRHAGRVGGTTAVCDTAMRALYFSKEVLPFIARDYGDEEETPVFHHVGVYAYTPDALARYRALPQGMLEQIEGLEQLRFLENDIAVHCVPVKARGREFWELNNPTDIALIEAIMKRERLE